MTDQPLVYVLHPQNEGYHPKQRRTPYIPRHHDPNMFVWWWLVVAVCVIVWGSLLPPCATQFACDAQIWAYTALLTLIALIVTCFSMQALERRLFGRIHIAAGVLVKHMMLPNPPHRTLYFLVYTFVLPNGQHKRATQQHTCAPIPVGAQVWVWYDADKPDTSGLL
jgi:hypothetical protein